MTNFAHSAAEIEAALAYIEGLIDCGAFTSDDVPHLRVLLGAAHRGSSQQGHDAPAPSTIELCASAHVAMRAWLESEFGADELHEQRIVDTMKAIREQIERPARDETMPDRVDNKTWEVIRASLFSHESVAAILGPRFSFVATDNGDIAVNAPSNMTPDDERRLEELNAVKPFGVRITVNSSPYRSPGANGSDSE